MGLVALILLLVLAPLGTCAVVCAIGWWSTVGPRLDHEARMFELGERAKLNAITIHERQMEMIGMGDQS